MSENNRGIGNIDSRNSPGVRGESYVFAIGIDQYENCPRLVNAVKDVNDFTEVLTKKYGFIKKNIFTLFNEQANLSNILKELNRLTKVVTANDSFLLYFSGHGIFEESFNEGYWIPVNARVDELGDYLPNSTIRQILSSIKGRHIFLIADSCFSGSLFASNSRSTVPVERLEKEPSRWGLTAGRNEIVSDGNAGENSDFAKTFLNILKANEKPLGVAELCAKVTEVVSANSRQTPRGEPITVSGHRGGQFYFHPVNVEASRWNEAIEKNSIQSFGSFLRDFPQSNHYDEAKSLQSVLIEEKAWKDACEKDIPVSYLDFINEFPFSKKVKDARSKLAGAEDKDAWEKAIRKGTITAFLDYIDQHENGGFIEAANDAIGKIRQGNKPPVFNQAKPVAEAERNSVTASERMPSTRSESTTIIVAKKGTRAANFAIDGFFIAILSVVLFFATFNWYKTPMHPGEMWGAGRSEQLNHEAFTWMMIVLGSTYFLYYFLFEALFSKTPSKFLTRTRVRSKSGGKPGVRAVSLRTLVRFTLPVDIIALFVIGESLHDRLSQTQVLND